MDQGGVGVVERSVRAQLEELARGSEIELVFFDGLDDALMGTVERFGPEGRYTVALYDREKCVEIFASQAEGNTGEERRNSAEEWMSFNVEDAHVGAATPAFFHRPRG
jgi:hypothetical protein